MQKRKVYLRRKAHIDNIKSDMSNFCDFYLDNLLNASVERKWCRFAEAVKETMEKNVPHKITSSRFNLPWFNRSHRRMCRKKQKLYNKAKKSKKPEDWGKFKSIRRTLHKGLSKSRNQYTSEFLVQSINKNLKLFWSHIKKVKNEKVGIADLEVNASMVSEERQKAEILSSEFVSIFTEEDLNNTPSLGNSGISNIRMLMITVNCKGVETQLLKLKDDKEPGPDKLHPWFLKMTAVEIAPILTDIFQTSIDSATSPNQWREANICAIHKKGPKINPSNYRLISLTCVTCKILEHIIYSHTMKHLEQHNVLVDSQHGFRSKRSAETQLVTTIHDIAYALQCNESVHLAILDFYKAFDKVNGLLDVIQYLKDRKKLLDVLSEGPLSGD